MSILLMKYTKILPQIFQIFSVNNFLHHPNPKKKPFRKKTLPSFFAEISLFSLKQCKGWELGGGLGVREEKEVFSLLKFNVSVTDLGVRGTPLDCYTLMVVSGRARFMSRAVSEILYFSRKKIVVKEWG